MLESDQSPCCIFNSNYDNSIIISSCSSLSSSSLSPKRSTISCRLMIKRKLVGSKRSTEGRKTANARERARMNVLNKAFSRLKSSLPWIPIDTKLSKLDTLRSALRYINYLAQLLHDNQNDFAYDNSNYLSFVNWPNQQFNHNQTEFIGNKTINQNQQFISSSSSSSSPINTTQDAYTLDFNYTQNWYQNNSNCILINN